MLLLNGFGMGTFHQHRLMQALHKELNSDKTNGSKVVIYGIDYLGQGKSWPENCADGNSENERGLQYSGQTWIEQIIEFIEQQIVATSPARTKVHLVGNSVGGHVAVLLAASRPDLVETITLLNATPIWGLNLPFWSGHLPAPRIPKAIGRCLFDLLRDPKTITKFIESTYANAAAYDDVFIQQIRNCTEGTGGHAAFASILWSPPITVQLPTGSPARFYECLEHIQCDVLLCFGRDDPWCKPAFAKRMLQCLGKRTNRCTQRYIELSNVGHCANHEAPLVTAQILARWIRAKKRQPGTFALLSEPRVVVPEPWGEITAQEVDEKNIPLNFFDRLATTII
jgi:pimeloyl-ACP methyl ester carboxylesterase